MDHHSINPLENVYSISHICTWSIGIDVYIFEAHRWKARDQGGNVFSELTNHYLH